MTRYTITLERDADLELFPGVRSPSAGQRVRVVVSATDEGGDGVRVWGARDAEHGNAVYLTRTERAQAEAAVAAIVADRGVQAEMFTEEAKAS